MRFDKVTVAQVVNAVGGGQMNTFSQVGDLNNNGRPDIVISGRNGRMIWLENQGRDVPWPAHEIDQVSHMECGGVLWDLTGSGYLDVINGSDAGHNEIYWWENPGVTGGPWIKRLVARTANTQFHDTAIGELGGALSLVFTNQHGGTNVYRVPLPDDPTAEPWPDLSVITTGRTAPNPYRESGVQPEEGLAIGDVDGDGVNELVCGTHWFKFLDGDWQPHRFARGYLTTKVAIGDLDGDGRNEIVLSEGDPCVYGKKQGGKLGWFKPGQELTGMWAEHVLEDELYDAHSLQLADLTGDGRLDIMIGEVGQSDWETDQYIIRPPRIMIYANAGQGHFARHHIDQGTGIHDGLLVDMLGRGVLDIVGKPLHGSEKWHVHVYYRVID